MGFPANSFSGDRGLIVDTEARHASEISLTLRVVAYLSVLLGYVFYCYNYIVVGYVRPYLVSQVGFSVADTAWIAMAGNVGVTIGAVIWAGIIARAGRRNAVIIIAAGIGIMALVQASTTILGVWIGSRLVMDALLGGYYVVATSLVVALFPSANRAKLIALNSAMYPGANILIGVLGGWLGETYWYVLLWLAAAPLPIAILLYFTIPKDRNYRPYDDDDDDKEKTETEGEGLPKGGWLAMFGPKLRGLTAGCILLSGIDFNAYQFFQGFLTLYIKITLGMSAAQMGTVIAFTSAGAFIGNFLWAIVADSFGRRTPLMGYVVASVMVIVFLQAGSDHIVLSLIGFVFGLGISCTAAWGAWFAEMFPLHLRAHGAALFHVGHILALGSPLIAAYTSESLGMVTSMSIATVFYVLGAALWFFMPETRLRKPRETALLDPEPEIPPARNEA